MPSIFDCTQCHHVASLCNTSAKSVGLRPQLYHENARCEWNGASGPVDEIKLPENMTFHNTHGRTTFVGTDEYNLEAKGVVPNIRVPVTVENSEVLLTMLNTIGGVGQKASLLEQRAVADAPGALDLD